MATTYGSIKQLVNQLAHATESIVYSPPATGSAEITSIWFHNSTSTYTTVKAWFPYSGITPTGSFSSSIANERLSEGFSGSYTLEVAPKVPFVLSGAAGDKITMRASQTSSISVVIYGREGNGTA